MSSDCTSTSAESVLSGLTSTAFHCGDRIGLTLVAQSACLSCVSVIGLLIYVSYLVFCNRHTPGWRFFNSHLDLYLLGLLFFDLIQSIGGIMDIRWISIAGVIEGPFCTAQGALEQFGDVGVALCSLAIAIHTFAELFLRWKEPSTFTLPIIVLSLYTVFLSLIVGVGYAVNNKKKIVNGIPIKYYGDTNYWCWIRKEYIAKGIGLEYLWLWIAAFISVAVYIPLFLVLKRVITVIKPAKTWIGWSVRRSKPDERKAPTLEHTDATVNARLMLYYPIVYIVTVLPIAVARIHAFVQPEASAPHAATYFSGMLFSASGFFNVLVYTITRPALLRPSVVPTDAPAEPGHSKGTSSWSMGLNDITQTRPGPPMANSVFEMDDVPPRRQGIGATSDAGFGGSPTRPDPAS